MWDMYQQQVVDCEPVFQHMHRKGMPVDATIRRRHAVTLQKRLQEIDAAIQAIIPEALLRHKHYKNVARGRREHPNGREVTREGTIKK